MDKPYRLLDGAAYVPAVKTDVRETFKRFGWVPPSEQKKVEPKEQESK